MYSLVLCTAKSSEKLYHPFDEEEKKNLFALLKLYLSAMMIQKRVEEVRVKKKQDLYHLIQETFMEKKFIQEII